MALWTEEQACNLRDLRLDPQRNPPEKLKALVRHFSEGGTVWAVTQGKGPVQVSRGLARKVRELTGKGMLRWVLTGAEPQADGLARATDSELGPHARELFYFGQRLRHLVALPSPTEVVKVTEEYEAGMWGPWPSGHLATSPRDSEEEAVARQWSSSRCDAGGHPLFPVFKQHLGKHPCWESLDCMGEAFGKYEDACRQAYRATLKEVKNCLPGTSDWDAKAVAMSLLMDGWHRKHGGPGLGFSYEPHEVHVEGHAVHQLRFGAWGTSPVNDPAQLQALAAVHQAIRRGPALEADLEVLAQAERTAKKAKAEFQDALSPDARLRKLIMSGHCDLCP